MEKKLEGAADIIARRGLFFRAFNIYGEVGGFYDYGPIGLRIKNNYIALWKRMLVEPSEAYEVDTTNIMPEPVFKASGHLSSFTDPIVKCGNCKTASRADKLLEEFYASKGDARAASRIEQMKNENLEDELKKNAIKCPKCGKSAFGKIETFNLLFKTMIGATGTETAYLRPETPQGIFIDFKLLYRLYSMKLPVAIAQFGKAYRNEISPRQLTIRAREFMQMDVELFFDPDDKEAVVGEPDMKKVLAESIPVLLKGEKSERSAKIGDLLANGTIPNKHFAMLLYLEAQFARALGFKEGKFRFRQVEVTPHYSKCNFDLEANSPYGYVELSGLAYRTDYDLSSHAKLSGEDLSVINNEKKVVPHVVELSIGVDRPLLVVLESAFEAGEDRGWPWLRLPSELAPYKFGVFPLQKDDKLIAKAKEVQKALAGMRVAVYYSETGSIGKRYARADEIGVPYGITIDFTTLEDGTVTVRDRDTTKQVRKKIGELS